MLFRIVTQEPVELHEPAAFPDIAAFMIAMFIAFIAPSATTAATVSRSVPQVRCAPFRSRLEASRRHSDRTMFTAPVTAAAFPSSCSNVRELSVIAAVACSSRRESGWLVPGLSKRNTP